MFTLSQVVDLSKKWHFDVPLELKKEAKQNPSKKLTLSFIMGLKSPDHQQQLQALELMSINGIGPSKAVELWKQGARLKNIRKFQDQLPLAAKLDLIHKPLRNIPHSDITKIAKEFIPTSLVKKIELVGSYRRGKETSNDIDILIKVPSQDEFDKVLQTLEKTHGKNWIVIAKGPSMVTSIFSESKTLNGRACEIDLWLALPDTYPAMLLYSTGSQRWNIVMRFVAKRKGLKLNQYGLFNGEKRIICKSEKDIFDAIGMKYKTPNERS